jgi:PHP family Zn ribbon phosphoesterase
MKQVMLGIGQKKYPNWICSSCGTKYGRRLMDRNRLACWHVGTCDLCGIEASVTEPRDFGGLHDGWKYHKK